MNRTTRNLAVAAFFVFVVLAAAVAGEDPGRPLVRGSAQLKTSTFSMGVELFEFGGDFGFGASLTSPWFLGNHAAVRVSGFAAYRDTGWNPYFGVRAGLAGGTLMSSADIRLYGDGGLLVLFPSALSDSSDAVFGGYGRFGFEFFIDPAESGVSYFMELGANGVAAIADREPGAPLYANGFSVTTGLRLYL